MNYPTHCTRLFSLTAVLLLAAVGCSQSYDYDIEEVKKHIDLDIDVNERDKGNRTPLHRII